MVTVNRAQAQNLNNIFRGYGHHDEFFTLEQGGKGSVIVISDDKISSILSVDGYIYNPSAIQAFATS